MKDIITFTTDKRKMDTAWIHGFINRSYWAEGRTVEEMMKCMEHSLNFGMFVNEKQIGYARVVTDTVQFAYLMDVYIDPEYRGKNYSVQLLEFLFASDQVKSIKVWRLATKDAHGLYEKFGFTPLKEPGRLMERIIKH